MTVVLRVPDGDLADFDAKSIGRDFAHVPGVARLVSAVDCGGGTARLVLDVNRAPGSVALSGEPVAELVADTLAKRGWKLSELTWQGDSFEAAFLEITDPEYVDHRAKAHREATAKAAQPGDPQGKDETEQNEGETT